MSDRPVKGRVTTLRNPISRTPTLKYRSIFAGGPGLKITHKFASMYFARRWRASFGPATPDQSGPRVVRVSPLTESL